MQAVNSPITEAIAQPGSLAGGSAMPAGFDTFLASLNQKMVARLDGRSNSDKSASPKADLGILNMQNLPRFASQAKESAKFTDPMQLLAAQLAAQGLINPALAQTAVVSPLLNGGNGMNAIDSTISLSGLNIPNGLGLNGQNIDPQQNRLISQSLAKAMKDSGQVNNLGAQNSQVMQLMQMLQQAKPVNAAQASALEQLKGLVTQVAQAAPQQVPTITLTQDQVNAIRDLAQQSNLPLAPQLASLVNPAAQVAQAASNQAPTITLTPEIASALRELQQQAKPVNAAQEIPKASTAELNLVNAAVTTTQPVVEKLTTKTLADSGIRADSKNVSALSIQNSKNSDNALTPLFAGQTSKENIGLDNSIRPRSESEYQTSKQEKVADLSAQDANTLSTPNSGLARLDNQTPEAIQKFQIKQTETSLVSGPLHSEIISAAKSGGGRIMFELTPPEQGTIRIDLRINQSGQAHLIVEGASDATKSRLDQGGQNLKQEFAQMGLNLSLDLRQGNQSQQTSGQSFANARQDYYAKQQNVDSTPKTMTSTGFIGSGHNRTASGTVHLFA
jgi:hypothetical protein